MQLYNAIINYIITRRYTFNDFPFRYPTVFICTIPADCVYIDLNGFTLHEFEFVYLENSAGVVANSVYIYKRVNYVLKNNLYLRIA